ncbi:hypothetical protein [Gemmata obscuriglobus]|uniref:hypothetical protein n=1 Tax=Gemmata obscuriglobus TaxID=114 RepID=UPI000D6CB645
METRTVRATPLLTCHDRWTGLKHGSRITRARTVKGVTTVEVLHGITSLTVERADARALLGLVRSHWRIENQRHDVRDVTLGADACRVRKGAAPQVLAALRNAAIHRLATVPADRTPEALEWLQRHPEHAHNLIGITQRE